MTHAAVGPPSDVAGDVATSDRRSYRLASGLSIVAAILVGISTPLAWVSTASHRPSAFHFGPGYFGPALLACAAVLLLAGVVLLTEHPRPNVCMPFVPALLALLLMASQWAGPLYTHAGVGVLVCFLGVATGVAAAVVLLPTEHPVRR